MANPLRGECQLNINGNQYRLVFDHNAVARISKQLLPEPWQEVGLRWIKSDFSPYDVQAMLWAGMYRHHPRLTFEQCGDLLSCGDPQEIANEMVPAFMQAFPKREGGTEPEGNAKAETGTGTPS